MKKLFLAIVVLVALGAAVYLYSGRLMEAGADRQAPAPGATGVPADAPAATGSPAVDASPRQRADALFWREPAGGGNEVWRFGAGSAPERHAVQPLDSGWQARVFAPGGWGGDDLIVWRNRNVGELRIWRLARDGAIAAFEVLPYSDNDWRIVAARDMDADGDADLVWAGPKGNIAVWTLDNGKPADKQVVGTVREGWTLAQVADVDGDGRAELLWRVPASGRMVLWTMNGTARAEQRELPGVSDDWTLIAVGQLDGAGGEDLLWRGATGTLAVWRGLSSAGAIIVQRPEQAGWTFAGLADSDGDGRAELLWRHQGDGRMGAWGVADDGKVLDVALPASPAGAEQVPVGFVAP